MESTSKKVIAYPAKIIPIKCSTKMESNADTAENNIKNFGFADNCPRNIPNAMTVIW